MRLFKFGRTPESMLASRLQRQGRGEHETGRPKLFKKRNKRRNTRIPYLADHIAWFTFIAKHDDLERRHGHLAANSGECVVPTVSPQRFGG